MIKGCKVMIEKIIVYAMLVAPFSDPAMMRITTGPTHKDNVVQIPLRFGMGGGEENACFRRFLLCVRAIPRVPYAEKGKSCVPLGREVADPVS